MCSRGITNQSCLSPSMHTASATSLCGSHAFFKCGRVSRVGLRDYVADAVATATENIIAFNTYFSERPTVPKMITIADEQKRGITEEHYLSKEP